uniref:Immunoglobulin G binding protein A n=1 Tax=Rhipicephalus zambeziensis TaxID=60191 RepID=A0A224YB00_9ACAR
MRLRTPLAALFVLWAVSETGLSLNLCSLCSAGFGLAIQRPVFQLPSVDRPVYLDPNKKGITDDMRYYIELLVNQPNLLPTITGAFYKLGIAIKRFKDTIGCLLIRGQEIQLPRKVPVDYSIKIENKVFHLPRETVKLTAYLSRNPHHLALVIPTLRGIGATFTRTEVGVSSFTLFNVVYKFERPLETQVSVGGKTFKLPKDLKLLIKLLATRPKDLMMLEVVLQVHGVKIKKNEGGGAVLQYKDSETRVNNVPDVRIKLGGRHYNIPTDLQAIFENPKTLHIGLLFESFQRSNIKLKVNFNTGVVVGIIVKGTLVPLPLTIDLRFKWDGKVYLIPRDMKALIAQLERKGLPSQVMHILYTRFGVIPVRNSAGIVIKLSFSGQLFAIKVEKQTAVTILAKKFYLPRDTKKMVAFVNGGDQNRTILMMQALQRAGFMFIPESDGTLETIQKGAQMITLGTKLKVTVNILGTRYRMPFDLPRLVDDVKNFGRVHINSMLKGMQKCGVKVTKKGSIYHILFNNVKYTVKA